MLWAKVSVGNLLPRWWLDVATAVHFYEAILATLAIIVWHFYQVFFDPDVYPDELGVVGWKMSLEHYREEHAPRHGRRFETPAPSSRRRRRAGRSRKATD